ncbi:MAG: hypothetical protein JST92_09935, partial [Deltaproteobacteria bacterium]|nr:hypothetical protein [Deltaproteobacteria bacterium]
MVANLGSTCAALALLIGLAACGGTDAQESGATSGTGDNSGDAGSDAGTGDAGTGDGGSGVPAVFDKFQGSATYQSTVTVSLSADGNYVVVDSNAIPNHKSPYFGANDSRHEADTNAGFNQNPNSIAAQTLVFKIPLHPSPAATPSQTPLGP